MMATRQDRAARDANLRGFMDILGQNIRSAIDAYDAKYAAASAPEKFEMDRKAVAMDKRQKLWSAHMDAGGDSRDPKFWKDWRGIEVSDGEVRAYQNEKRWLPRAAFGTKQQKAHAEKKLKAKYESGRVVFVHMNGYPEDDGTGCPLSERTF